MPNISRFPERDKGRKRKRGSIMSMGRTAIRTAEHWGEEVELGNVVDLTERRRGPATPPVADEGIMLAGMIFAMLPEDSKKTIRESVQHLADHGSEIARSLHLLIRKD